MRQAAQDRAATVLELRVAQVLSYKGPLSISYNSLWLLYRIVVEVRELWLSNILLALTWFRLVDVHC